MQIIRGTVNTALCRGF